MSFAPLDTAPLMQRLRDLVPALRQVAGAADYAAVKRLQDYPSPCAYVVLAREKGTSNSPGHAPRGQQVNVAQIVGATFGVVLAVRNYREQRGAQVSDELREFVGAIREALVGYVPDMRGARAIQWIQGDLTAYDAGTALWTEVYQVQHSIGSNQQ